MQSRAPVAKAPSEDIKAGHIRAAVQLISAAIAHTALGVRA